MKFSIGDKVICQVRLVSTTFERDGEIIEVDEENDRYKILYNNRMLESNYVKEEDVSIDLQPNREKRLYELLKEENQEIEESWGYDERE